MSTINFSINFFIKAYKINANGLVTIFARILVNELKTEFSTNRQIKPNQRGQKIQQIINHINSDQINTYLLEFKSRLNNAQSQLFIAKREVTGEMIKALVLKAS